MVENGFIKKDNVEMLLRQTRKIICLVSNGKNIVAFNDFINQKQLSGGVF